MYETLSDMRLIRRAIKERWPVPAESRAAIVEQLMNIIEDPHSRPRKVLAAAHVLIAAEAQNQADEFR